MEALYLLIPLSVVIVFVAIWVFFKASDGGQFDDLVGPGMRILQDDDERIQGIDADPHASDKPAADKAAARIDPSR